MRVATYTRLSPNPDKDDTVNQGRDLNEFAKMNKWELFKEYKDVHVSGSKKGKDRPAFKEMMEDASKGKFDILLFWSLDRLSREGVYETITYLNQLTSYNVGYRSYTEQFLDTCGIFKDAVIAIMATIAKQERIRLIERTKAGLETAKAKGVVLGRPRRELDIIKIFRWASANRSYGEIARELKVDPSMISRVVEAYSCWTRIHDREKMYRLVKVAIRQGKLVRPNNCSKCGIECKPHAHHEDHDKPYDVVWLCPLCHKRRDLELITIKVNNDERLTEVEEACKRFLEKVEG